MPIFLRPERALLIILLASAATLVSVFVAEYGFKLKPCELCLLQRYPYAILIVLSVFGLAMSKPKLTRGLLVVSGVLFIISTGFGTYHAGVEKGIFQGPSACVAQPSDHPLTIEELKAQIMGAPMVACNEPAWQWHGLTMAGMNAVFSLLMAGFCFFQFAQFRKVKP